jgi:phosphate starvation-inducible PhoH-like protein
MKKNIYINNALIPTLLGNNDTHIRKIMKKLDIEIVVRNDEFTFIGKENNIDNGIHLIENLIQIAEKRKITSSDIKDALNILSNDTNGEISKVLNDKIIVAGRVKTVVPKTTQQKDYVDAIRNNEIVFGIGPAGTGKTYLAMAMAINYYLDKKVSRIVLTRPAVEAGEKLGFLPGDIADKINPYLRPLYDALYDMIGVDRALRLIDKGIIELAPLAFMRGRTLNDAFIILDEAQNSTSEQMKMFLTRLGYNSKAVITGDITQIDLPTDKNSGLITVTNILKKIKGVHFTYFSEIDVVRHSIVQKIIKAYEKFEEKKK